MGNALENSIVFSYEYDINSYTPLFKKSDGQTSVTWSETAIHKTGRGDGAWMEELSGGFFSGTIKETTVVQSITPLGEKETVETSMYFIGNTHVPEEGTVKYPIVELCVYTGEFSADMIRSAGEIGLPFFCTQPEYGYFGCEK